MATIWFKSRHSPDRRGREQFRSRPLLRVRPNVAGPVPRLLASLARMTSPLARLRKLARETPLRGLGNFVSEELSSPVRFSRPDLLLRGYVSNRRWLYDAVPRTRDGYVSDRTYARAVERIDQRAINADFVDKVRFAEVLEAGGFGDRTPRILGVKRGGRFAPLREHQGGRVIFKPVGGHAGQGVGLRESLDEAVRDSPDQGAFLLQEEVRAHASVRELFPGSLNTLRVHAYRPQVGGPSRVVVTVQRIGRAATAPVDSFSRGGLVARVQPDATLTAAVAPITDRRRQEHTRHPDTGAQIEGRTVPRYQEAVALVLAAMDLWPRARWVGWDIAIGEDGPLIIEGNTNWPSIRLLQAHGPLAADPDVRRFLEEQGAIRGR